MLNHQKNISLEVWIVPFDLTSPVDFSIPNYPSLFDREKWKFSTEFKQHLCFLTSLISCLCFRGTQILDLKVEGSRPLPFAFDILSAAFQYGNRAFTEYPPGIPDYFKQSFPEGFCWERNFAFEDGGMCIATNDIKLVRFKVLCSKLIKSL